MALIAGILLLGAPGQVPAAEHYAIMWNLTGTKQSRAYIDVGIDTRAAPEGSAVTFLVTDLDGQPFSEFTLLVNSRGFVTSSSAAPPNDNLLAVSGGQPARVRVTTPLGATNEYAVLHQTERSTNLTLGVPPARDLSGQRVAIGTFFPVTLGDFSRATLLVGNVSGADVSVDVFVGTKGADGAGKYTIPVLHNNEIGRIDIDPTDARSHLVLSTNGGDIFAQLVLDKGKGVLTAVTLIPLD
jgi:hypothetical protein